MSKEKNRKSSGILYVVCTIIWIIVAIMFFAKGSVVNGCLDICLAMLCLVLAVKNFKGNK